METEFEAFFGKQQRPTRSINNIRKVGDILDIEPRTVNELIYPQDVHVFRLHINLVEHPLSVWGCISFHNRAKGIYKGGIRISSDLDIWDTIELSRLMTLKTSLVDLEFGGAKTGLRFDMSKAYKLFGKEEYDIKFESYVKKEIIKEFAHHYHDILSKKQYVPAPDINTGPAEMAWIYGETHEPSSVTGKPEGVPGWLPGRKEATGYGVYIVVKNLIEKMGQKPGETTVAIQGFGNVGSNSAFFLDKLGVKIVAVEDKDGSVYNEEGIDVTSLTKYVTSNGTVKGFCDPAPDFFGVEADIMVPAAINDAIDAEAAKKIKAKYVVEGANFPTTPEAMEIFEKKGIEVIPDILANAGGVIASSVEYANPVSTQKMDKEEVFAMIERKISKNLNLALDIAKERSISLDLACTFLSAERLITTMQNKGWI